MRKISIVAATLIAVTPAFADSLGEPDIATIVNVYRQNSVKFRRDYVGAQFSASLPFKSAGEHWYGGLTASFGNVVCLDIVGDTKGIADWREGGLVSVNGTIEDVTLGTVQLKNCHLQQ